MDHDQFVRDAAALRGHGRRELAAIVRSLYPGRKGEHQTKLLLQLRELQSNNPFFTRDKERLHGKDIEGRIEINADLNTLGQGSSIPRLALYLYWLWSEIDGLPDWMRRKRRVAEEFYSRLGLSPPDTSAIGPTPSPPPVSGIELPDYRSHDVHVAVSALRKRLTEGVIDRADLREDIDRFVEDALRGRNAGVLIVTAPAGFGKSTLAADWCRRNATESRSVVSHFCSALEPVTLDVQRGLEYLSDQIAHALGETVTGAKPVSQIAGRLQKGMPAGQHLIVWLDGVDEVRGDYENFLPDSLGPGTCVVISTRADTPNDLPHLDFLTDRWSLRPSSPRSARLEVGKFTWPEFIALVTARVPREKLGEKPDNILSRLYHGSDDGHPLLSECIIQDLFLLNNRNPGSPGGSAMSDAYTALTSYAYDKLVSLQRLPSWDTFGPAFSMLCILREAVGLDLLNNLIGPVGKLSSLHRIPVELRRWLRVESSSGSSPLVVSFAHAQLQTAFRLALRSDAQTLERELCGRLDNLTSAWSGYDARHLIAHLWNIRDLNKMYAMLRSKEFYHRRIEVLGHALANQVHQQEIQYTVARISDKREDQWMLRDLLLSVIIPAPPFWSDDHPAPPKSLASFGRAPGSPPMDIEPDSGEEEVDPGFGSF